MKYVTLLFWMVLMVGCASSAKPIAVVVPAAQSEVIYGKNLAEKPKFDFIYERDNHQRLIYQQIWTDVVIYGGEADTPQRLNQLAKQKAIRQAVEELNGTLLHDETRIASWSTKTNSGNYSRQDMTSDLYVEVLGIGQIKQEKCQSSVTEHHTLIMTCAMLVAVPKVIDIKQR